MATYIALLRKECDSDYGVSFLDFPGCVTAGESLEEARQFAAEVLEFHIQGMVEDGEAIPEPSSLDAIAADPASTNAVAFLVEVPDPKPRHVRINITMPTLVLREVDDYAQREKLSRSAFLAVAAMERIRARQRTSRLEQD